MSYLAIQFSSLDTTTGLTDYADGPSCNASTPNNYYFGIAPLPGQVSLLSSPNGCNGSVTTDFGTFIKDCYFRVKLFFLKGGVYNGTPLNCTNAGIPIATISPPTGSVPTPTPTASTGNSSSPSFVLPIIIIIVILLLLCCLILVCCFLYRRRDRKHKKELERFSTLGMLGVQRYLWSNFFLSDFGTATKDAPPMYVNDKAVMGHSDLQQWNESQALDQKVNATGGSAASVRCKKKKG